MSPEKFYKTSPEIPESEKSKKSDEIKRALEAKNVQDAKKSTDDSENKSVDIGPTGGETLKIEYEGNKAKLTGYEPQHLLSLQLLKKGQIVEDSKILKELEKRLIGSKKEKEVNKSDSQEDLPSGKRHSPENSLDNLGSIPQGEDCQVDLTHASVSENAILAGRAIGVIAGMSGAIAASMEIALTAGPVITVTAPFWVPVLAMAGLAGGALLGIGAVLSGSGVKEAFQEWQKEVGIKAEASRELRKDEYIKIYEGKLSKEGEKIYQHLEFIHGQEPEKDFLLKLQDLSNTSSSDQKEAATQRSIIGEIDAFLAWREQMARVLQNPDMINPREYVSKHVSNFTTFMKQKMKIGDNSETATSSETTTENSSASSDQTQDFSQWSTEDKIRFRMWLTVKKSEKIVELLDKVNPGGKSNPEGQ